MVVLDYGWRSVIEVIVSLLMSASSDLQLLSRRKALGENIGRGQQSLSQIHQCDGQVSGAQPFCVHWGVNAQQQQLQISLHLVQPWGLGARSHLFKTRLGATGVAFKGLSSALAVAAAIADITINVKDILVLAVRLCMVPSPRIANNFVW